MTQIITIDGPAASGKGTLARRLATHLNFFYLDTGKMYRLMGLKATELNIAPEDNVDRLVEIANDLSNDFDIEALSNPELLCDTIGQMASRCASLSPVRLAVLELQRNLANNPPKGMMGTVLDGRDCGTVICPDAPHKFYITASTEVRAKRRFLELQSRGDTATYDDVYEDTKIRDDRDMNRPTAPLKPADDAIIIDTSDMNANQAFEMVLDKLV